MSKDIKGKVAVVTGASGGIGLEFCRALARRGADIVMIAIEDKQLHDAASRIAEEYHVNTYPLTIDLCHFDADSLVEKFIDSHTLEPYILVNNAGIFSFDYLNNVPARKIEAFVDLHIRIVTLLCRRFSARMATHNGGYILNMSSMSCWMPMPGLSLYSATKAYIRVFSRALHYEMRDKGVSVMVACPGGIATDLFGLPENLKKLALNLHAIEKPDRFAEKALRRLLRGKAQYINGPLNRIAILAIGLTPRSLRMQVKKQLLDRGIHR